MTHQPIDKKIKIFFYLLIFFLFSTINNTSLIKNFNPRIQNINVKGIDDKLKPIIEKKFNYLLGKNIFFINKTILIEKIKNINFIETFEIRKNYPHTIEIQILPAQLIAITYLNNEKIFIGNNGKFIKENISEESNLPRIFGNFLINDYLELINLFKDSGLNYKNFKNFYYFPNKRWDVDIRENLVVKLPRKNVKESIDRIIIILKENEINEINTIDLRISNRVILN